MYHVHFTEKFSKNIENSQYKDAIYEKINLLKITDRPEQLSSISRFAKDILVYKKNNSCRVIIQREKIDERNIEVLFIRDFISNQDFDYYWGKKIYPQLINGEWLDYNGLPSREKEKFFLDLKQAQKNKNNRPNPPFAINGWLNGYKLKINFDIFEKEEWVDYSTQRGPAGLEERYILNFKKLVKKIYDDDLEDCRSSRMSPSLFSVINHDNIGIIYSKHKIDSQFILLLHDGAHINFQSERWHNALKKAKDSHFNYTSIQEISEDAFRAYPKWVIESKEEEDFWCLIQRSKGINNLSLLPEQVKFLSNFRFPSYINGQAGSGKSTMLYYLFANVYWYKMAEEFEGEIVFLTENENLLEDTGKAVTSLLQLNPEFDGIQIDKTPQVRTKMMQFKDFLLDFIQEDLDKDVSSKFPENKYLDFGIFKSKFNESYKTFNYSAEEVWFVISTYVYGYRENLILDSSEKYLKKETGVPRGFRLINAKRYNKVVSEALPFYQRLIKEGWWDKNTLVRAIRKIYPKQLPKKYTVIFCDEAQDFSRIELRLILQASSFIDYDLSTPYQQIPIVFAGDALQTVNPTGFSVVRLHQMFYDILSERNYKYNKKQSTYEPSFNYRSTKPIVRIANIIQSFRKNTHTDDGLKQEAKMGKQSKQIPIIYPKEWIASNDIQTKFIEKFKYKSFIVPIDLNEENDFKSQDALLKDNFADVKSSIAAKGAEYPQVVVYGFGDEYLNEFQRIDWNIKLKDNFPVKFFFNKLYVAITRAQKELIIVDSNNAISKFWKPLFEQPIQEKWEPFSSFEEIVIIHPETLDYSLDSENEDAYQNACVDLELGVKDKNISRLTVASNIFFMLNKKKKGYEALAHKELLKENWKKSGSYFIDADKLEEAANVFFQAKIWDDLRHRTSTLRSDKQTLRLRVASFMTVGEWSEEELLEVVNLRNHLRELLRKVTWREEFIEQLIEYIETLDKQSSIRDLAFVLEAIIQRGDNHLYEALGYIYLSIKQYKEAIESWDNINKNTANQNIEFEEMSFYLDYLKAHNEKARTESNSIEELLWTGRIIAYKKDNLENYNALINKFIQKYEEVTTEVQSSNLAAQIYENLHLAAVSKNNLALLVEVGRKLERTETDKRNLKEIYVSLIKSCQDENISIYFKERWVKVYWELLKDNLDENSSEIVSKLNEKYQKKNFPFEEKFIPWTREEILLITNEPFSIPTVPPNTYRNVLIRNFRGFNEIEISNIGMYNLILGNNNAGKTSLLESFLIAGNVEETAQSLSYVNLIRGGTSETFWKNIKNRLSDSEHLKFTVKGNRRVWGYVIKQPTEKELVKVKETDNLNTQNYILIENLNTNKKEVSGSLSVIHTSLENQTQNEVHFIPFGKTYNKRLAKEYFDKIAKRRKLRENFKTQMRIFIPNLVDIIIDPEDDTVIIEEELGEDDYTSLPLYNYGDGAIKLFRILVEIFAAKDKRLAIDEIDAGIHYSKFKRFWEIVIKSAKLNNVQLFATTHNTECIKYMKEALEEEELKSFQKETRVITLNRHAISNKIIPVVRDFERMEYAYDYKIELRGEDEEKN